MATHPYQGEDEDELTFEKGAIIAVIPYDDPEDEVGMAVKSRVLANVWICLRVKALCPTGKKVEFSEI